MFEEAAGRAVWRFLDWMHELYESGHGDEDADVDPADVERIDATNLRRFPDRYGA